MTRTRPLAALALSLALTAGLAPTAVHAEDPPPPAEGGETEGRSLDGYFLGGLLGGLVLFIVGKSARRS